MASIHEAVARALVEFLNAGINREGQPIYTGALGLGPDHEASAEFAWQPLRGKAAELTVLVVPMQEVREAICRGQVAKQSVVSIAVRQQCTPTDDDKISRLDQLTDDIKNATELTPMAGRAWESQINDPLYPKAPLEETKIYLAIVNNTYQHEA